MKHLPLYPAPVSPERLERNGECARCKLGQAAGQEAVCAWAESANSTGPVARGGALVIHEFMFLGDARSRALFTSQAGRWLRELLKVYPGEVTLDVAVRCDLHSAGVPPTEAQECAEICAPYAAQVIHEVKPERIVAIGALAHIAVLGRKVDWYSTRGGIAWYTHFDGSQIPVFCLPSMSGLDNRFMRQMFEQDLARALTLPREQWRRPPLSGSVRVIETIDDALMAERDLNGARAMYLDAETMGVMFTPRFRVLCVSVAPQGANYAWVYTEQSLEDPEIRASFARVMTSSVPKGGQNVKYDQKTILSKYGVLVTPMRRDVRLIAKMRQADASADLETLSEFIGMGGMKDEAEHHIAQACALITKSRNAHTKSIADAAKAAAKEATTPVAASVPAAVAVTELVAVDAPTTGKRKRVSKPKVPKEKPRKIMPWEEVGEDVAKVLLMAIELADLSPRAFAFALVPPDILYRYNARDAIAAAILDEWLTVDLSTPEDEYLLRHYDRLVGPAITAFTKIEATGVLIDRTQLSATRVYCATALANLDSKIQAFAPGLNPGSHPQLREFVYGRLKMPVNSQHLTDSGEPSTDEAALQTMRDKHPAIAAILEWRMYNKILGTYIDGLESRIAADGRIHPTFLLDGARSGRTSCTEPNLQNIPRKGSIEGKMVKDLFVAPPGYTLLQLDYSQLELRVAALMSGDPLMEQIYTSIDPATGKPTDYHRRTAQLISQIAWGVPPDQITDEHRNMAKVTNFGLLYGMTDGGLAKRLGCSKAQAAKIRLAIFGQFRRLDAWIKEQVMLAKTTGYCYTLWKGERARRRPLYGIGGPNDSLAAINAYNGSFNTPVQGTASDFMIRSIVEIIEWLESAGIPARVVLTVHDSVIIEVRNDWMDVVCDECIRIMASQGWGTVPLVVDAEHGTAWGSLEKRKKK